MQHTRLSLLTALLLLASPGLLLAQEVAPEATSQTPEPVAQPSQPEEAEPPTDSEVEGEDATLEGEPEEEEAQDAEETDTTPVLDSISSAFGASIWNALPLEYELFGRNKRDRLDVPGMALSLNKSDVQRTAPRKTEELFKLLPGLHSVSLDSMGIRPNISGLSGTNPIGTRHLLILEDGVPMNPTFMPVQAVPYMTTAARVQRLEFLQGGYGVLQPSRNLSGSLNLVTLQPPNSFETNAYLHGGSFGRLHWGASAGDLQGAVGYMFEVHRREFDGPFNLNLTSTDVAGKFRLQMSERAWFDAKVAVYNETSQPRIIGLTEDLAKEQPRVNLSPNDREELDRWSVNLSHSFAFGQFAIIQTSGWAQRYSWNRRHQQVDRESQTGALYERVLDIDNIPNNNGALYFRDATNVEELQTTLFGAQTQVNLDFGLGNFGRSEVVLGARAEFESHNLEQRQGNQSNSPAGNATGYEELTSNTLAAFTAGRLFLFDETLRIMGGSRIESISLRQGVWCTPYNPQFQGQDLDPILEDESNKWAVLPGAGLSWDALDSLILFASARRSMTPLDVSRPTGANGERLRLEPTFAWRYEAGPKVPLSDWFSLEASGFFMQTEDLVLATENARVGRNVDANQWGASALLTADLARPLRLPFRIPVRAHYTWTKAEIQDDLPNTLNPNFPSYNPEHRAGAQLAFEHPLGFDLSVTGLYLSEQNSSENLITENEQSGAQGIIEESFSLDARVAYTHLPWGVTAYILGKNLLDDQRIVARQRGIQLGGVREFIGGVEASF